MRKKGIKWAVGTLSIAAIAFSIFMISNNTHAQTDDSSTDADIEVTVDSETPSADMDTDKNMKCDYDKSNCKSVCTPEECENMSEEECEAFCKDKKEMIEEGGC